MNEAPFAVILVAYAEAQIIRIGAQTVQIVTTPVFFIVGAFRGSKRERRDMSD